jgi:hypothetical protein
MKKWMWLTIEKPLCHIIGRAPPELSPMPQSWVVFAIPVNQTERTKEV